MLSVHKARGRILGGENAKNTNKNFTTFALFKFSVHLTNAVLLRAIDNKF